MCHVLTKGATQRYYYTNVKPRGMECGSDDGGARDIICAFRGGTWEFSASHA